MALGLQTLQKTPGRALIRLLEGANTSAAPTIADPANAVGAPTSGRGGRVQLKGRADPIASAILHLYNTAGSGAITLAFLRLWGWCAATGLWGPIGTGTDADKGKINAAGGYAFGEVASDKIVHYERILDPGLFDYITAELGTVAGQADTGAGQTIAVVAAAKTFTRSAGSYLTDGFAAGQSVTTSGFTGGNNGTFTIESVTATVMTMTSSTGLADEAGGGNERITDTAVPLFNVDLIVPVNEGRR